MSPINHFLTGWALACMPAQTTVRDRAAITLAAVIPDLDGIGLIAEMATRNGMQPLTWWSDYHHVLAHNLLFGLFVALLVYAWCERRVLIAAFALFAFHLHLVEDLLVGRDTSGSPWSISYLYPFSSTEFFWSGQLALNAWPNFIVALLLLSFTLQQAWRYGYSPLELFSSRANSALVTSLRQRWPR